ERLPISGCEGNPNKFETFELCQKTCEVSGLDPCLEPLDRGSWCEAMSNRYYFNKRSRQCKGFHYTGCGKSGNNFLSKEECHEKCEKRYPRSVAIPATPVAQRGKGKKKPPPAGYSGKKPEEMPSMLRHVVLDGVNQTYYKSDPEWANYGLCLGYRLESSWSRPSQLSRMSENLRGIIREAGLAKVTHALCDEVFTTHEGLALRLEHTLVAKLEGRKKPKQYEMREE
ncbi:Kunitz/Bovine pancreatic trypsin inhibitor domain protein, partial [Cooperia oncophora]